MTKPWVEIPAKNIHIDLPISMNDNVIRIMFRDAETIDMVIEQLGIIKEFLKDERIIVNDCK